MNDDPVHWFCTGVSYDLCEGFPVPEAAAEALRYVGPLHPLFLDSRDLQPLEDQWKVLGSWCFLHALMRACLLTDFRHCLKEREREYRVWS